MNKNITALVVATLLAIPSLADKPAPDPKAMAKAGADAFAKAFNAKDVKSLVAGAADDVEFIYAFSGQEGKGKAALEKFYSDSFAGGPPTSVALQDCDGIAAGDNIVIAMCSWEDTITMPDGKQQKVGLHSSEILTKQKDGKWLLKVDHASFMPPPPPGAAQKK